MASAGTKRVPILRKSSDSRFKDGTAELKLIGADGLWIDQRRLPWRISPPRPRQRPVVLDPTPRRLVAG
jgi:hypothetical protein